MQGRALCRAPPAFTGNDFIMRSGRIRRAHDNRLYQTLFANGRRKFFEFVLGLLCLFKVFSWVERTRPDTVDGNHASFAIRRKNSTVDRHIIADKGC